MQLLLLCHGETEFEDNGIALGWLDKSLSDQGKLAVEKYANSLKEDNRQIDLIITSPLTRSRLTAVIISQILTVNFIENELIKERNLGDLTGKKEDPFQLETIPNGESAAEVNNRVKKFVHFLIQLRNGGKYQRIMIVTHKSIVKEILILLKDYSDAELKDLTINNLSQFELEI